MTSVCIASVQLFAIPWIVPCLAPLSLESQGKSTGVVAISFSNAEMAYKAK